MKTQTESMSARIRKLLAVKPHASAKFVAAALKCSPSLVHQVKSYDKKQAEKRKPQSLALCQLPEGNGLTASNPNGNGMTFAMSSPQDTRLNPPAICEPADIVLLAKALAARCGGVDGLRQLLDAIAAK